MHQAGKRKDGNGQSAGPRAGGSKKQKMGHEGGGKGQGGSKDRQGQSGEVEVSPAGRKHGGALRVVGGDDEVIWLEAPTSKVEELCEACKFFWAAKIHARGNADLFAWC